MDNISLGETINCTVHKSKSLVERIPPIGEYSIKLIRNNNSVFETKFKNLITIVGSNDLLNNYLAGSNYTAAFYMGLVGTGGTTFSTADTMSSHAGWSESTHYNESARPTLSWGAASGASKTSGSVTFTINAADTIQGCFLTTSSSKGGTSGTLFSVGGFTGRAVDVGDLIVITYTIYF